MRASTELADMQGILRSAYTALRFAQFNLYSVTDQLGGRAFLRAILPKITDAAARDHDVVTQFAVTATGLRSLGFTDELISTFSPEFTAGITAPTRSTFLGDTGEQAPANWTWGGPHQTPVDLLVMTYARTADTLTSACSELARVAAYHQVSLGTALATSPWSPQEPFGFRDGISQPRLDEFASRNPNAASREVFAGGRAVAIGEFVLGHPNAYGQLTERPVVPRALDPERLLPDDGAGGGADLGRDGSYLVLRTLAQDVAGFWAYATSISGDTDPRRVAAKMVGRWPNGAPVTMSPDHDDPALGQLNDFGFHADDAAGLRCPLGAHIRRANPRDSLDPHPGSAKSLAVTDRHRLLRRGRKFGIQLDVSGRVPEVDDAESGGERGLHFLALNGNLSRQFEFVQHSWLNSEKFAGMYEDVDPVAGIRGPEASTFTIQALPFRRRLSDVPSFVTTRGGAYFFLPGIKAIRFLAAASAT